MDYETLRYYLIDLYGMLIIGILCILAPMLVEVFRHWRFEREIKKEIEGLHKLKRIGVPPPIR